MTKDDKNKKKKGMDWDAIERRLLEEALEEEKGRMPELIEDDIKGILNMTGNQLKEELKSLGYADGSPEFLTAMADYHRSVKAAEGSSWFSAKDPEKARAIIKDNKVLNKINDKKKKGFFDCFTVIVAFLVVTIGGMYAIAEYVL